MKDNLKYSVESLAIHADDDMGRSSDVSAPINVSTTFKYPNDPAQLLPEDIAIAKGITDVDYYSRMGDPVTRRVEEVLKNILKGESVLYSCGLSAFHAAMLHFNPKRVFVGDCYHGCHGVMEILKRNYGLEIHPLEDEVIKSNIQKGDLIHVETPINPFGTAFDIEHYAKLAHDNGAYLLVDATFAPPPLQNPFDFGADMVMHSATKFLGGHSDLLAGVLVTQDTKVQNELLEDRGCMGTVAGSLESWLLLRSLRTFTMRFKTQMSNASKVVKFLSENKEKLTKLSKVYHSDLQTEEFVKKQLPLGGSPVFSIECVDVESAKALPSKLGLFNHATSLGGVESLIEWRRMSDDRVSETLLRLSIGVENVDDLISDLEQALS